MEDISHLLKAKIRSQELKGLTPHPGLDPQSHQQFVDNTMLFGKALGQEARVIKNCLNTFLTTSGLEVNNKKSQIFFFNTRPITKHNIYCILDSYEGNIPSKYLGAPLSDSMLRNVS